MEGRFRMVWCRRGEGITTGLIKIIQQLSKATIFRAILLLLNLVTFV